MVFTFDSRELSTFVTLLDWRFFSSDSTAGSAEAVARRPTETKPTR